MNASIFLKKLKLAFKEAATETKFMSKSDKSSPKLFGYYGLVKFMVCILLALSKITTTLCDGDFSNLRSITFQIGLFVCPLISLNVMRFKFPTSRRHLAPLEVILLAISEIELAIYYINHFALIPMSLGLSLELLICTLVLSSCWYVATGLMITSNIYYIYRVISLLQIGLKWDILFLIMVWWIVLATIFWNMESLQRREFHSNLQIREIERTLIQKAIQSFRSFLDFIPEASFVLKNSEIEFFNKNLVALLNGESKNSKENSTLQIIKDGISNFYSIEVDKKTQAQNKVHLTLQNFLFRRDGFLEQEFYYQNSQIVRSFHIDTKNIALFDQDFLVVLFKETTAMKELSEAKTMCKYKTMLLASTSHELRTPLNGMIGMFDVLESFVQTQGKHFLEIAKNSSKLLVSLINDILDYAQAENGKLKLSYESFKIRHTIVEIVDLLQMLAIEKNIKLVTEIAEDVPYEIYSDQHRIRQILMNLVGNAIKFTMKGYVKVKCLVHQPPMRLPSLNQSGSIEEISESETERTSFFVETASVVDENLIHLEFIIEDTGVGIKDDDKKTIFNVFGRIEHENPINPRGCGLGLTISKSLANNLGGDITFESEHGYGSTFKFSIPTKYNKFTAKSYEYAVHSNKLGDIYRRNKSEESMNASPSLKSESSLRRIRRGKSNSNGTRDIDCGCADVLIVDDNVLSSLAVKSMLIQMNIRTEQASSGEIALNKLYACSRKKCGCFYKLIFMDLHMPDMTGVEACRKIRHLQKIEDIPYCSIVALTGATSPKEEHSCISAGMDEVQQKPISLGSLRKCAKKYVS